VIHQSEGVAFVGEKGNRDGRTGSISEGFFAKIFRDGFERRLGSDVNLLKSSRAAASTAAATRVGGACLVVGILDHHGGGMIVAKLDHR